MAESPSSDHATAFADAAKEASRREAPDARSASLPPEEWLGPIIPGVIESANHLVPFHREFAAHIFQPLTPEFWIVWVRKNKDCMLFAVSASMH